jgi:NADPH:quinone reductase-like Zn-dependent oxidoreductase
MKAYVLPGFDRDPEFRDVPKPEPGPGEIRISVRGTSVNPVDQLVRMGFFRAAQEYRFPAIFGRDVSGVVEAVGPSVTRYSAGDHVFGFVKRAHIGNGTFAEYVVVPEDMFVSAAPATLSLPLSGTLGLSGITALECVEGVPSGPGDVVVVNGASGGLGTYAIQIAKARGAIVIATARSTAAAEMVRALGADHVVNPREADLVQLVRQVVPEGATGFVDLVKHSDPLVMGDEEDGKYEEFARLCRGVLRDGGAATSVTNGGLAELLEGVPFTNVHSTPSPESLARLAALVDDGLVTPVVAATFGFDDIDRAFERLKTGGNIGKVAVTFEAWV